jgi:uncharacterized membrane protein YdjX (TVP38/TMEM64 family)
MEQVLFYLEKYSEIAIVTSIGINIIISVLGVVPSYFLTGANITFFGFWHGTLISIIGETIGAIVSFFIYRKGFRNISHKMHLGKESKLRKLLHVEGTEAFYLILSFRLFPFIPSGAVNIFAALGKVSSLIFITASSIGKIPALLVEAYSIMQVAKFNNTGKIILIVVSLYCLVKVYRSICKGTASKSA